MAKTRVGGQEAQQAERKGEEVRSRAAWRRDSELGVVDIEVRTHAHQALFL